MPVVELSRAKLGLMSVEDAARCKSRDVRTVQRWIAAGLIPALVLGRGIYLLLAADVKGFTPPTPGRSKQPARKPRKESTR